ncbi:T9SS type A sorting domain-containing protein [Flavobacterium sp.]|uniref:T9SS type A sorting domain-containing protein n=1 Tax=Flavobacterium sp. TaxID=239 RepID=UPI002611B1E2|nr:T9SS type A sorting domain-containing protein [Flavobacterium sp.]
MRKTLLLLFCFQSLIISSQILDPTFGTSGIANNQLTNFTSTDICHKAAIQSDDKLVYAGQSDIGYYIARTNVNGTLDTSFNDIGYKLINGKVNSIAILFNGQIMYGAGTAIFLLNSDGSPDTTFGNQGWVRIDYNSNYIYIVSIKIQNDGKILILGSYLDDFCTIRLNPNGSYDTTFDSDGKVILSVGVSIDEPSEIEIQTDGKIIITGRSINYTSTPNIYEIATFRYLSNGTLDTSFAVNGISKIDYGSNSMDLPQDLKLQPDGKIVLLCHTQTYKITLLRFNSNGTYDTTFDLDGILNTNYTDYQNQNAKPKLIIKPNGKILCSFSRSKIFTLMQINSDGTADTSFGVNGLASYNNGEICTSKYLYISSQGYIVTGGRSIIGTSTNFFYKITNVTFDINGIFQNTTNFNIYSSYDDIKNICELSTGKTIALTLSKNSNTLETSSSLARFNSDGSIDTTYGSNGLIPLTIKVQELKKCSNNKVILNAFSSLHKLNEDGTYDTGFGTNGIVDFSSSNGSIGRSFQAIEVTDNDQIYALLVNVDYSIGEGLFSMELLRLNANGTVDTTFGTNGYALYRFNSNGIDNSESPYCLSILSNGQIIVSGTVFSSPHYLNYFDFGIGSIKFNTNGTLDTSFGTNGKVLSTFNNVYIPKKIVCTTNDEIIINALDFETGNTGAIIKYNSNGSLDSSYGTNGVVDDLFLNNDMIIQPDNKILKTGQLNNDITTVRYNTNGTLDTTFGNQGYLTTIINQHSSPNDLLLLSNGSLLIAGNSSNTGIYASQARYTDLNFVTNNNTQSNKTVFYPNPIRNIANFDFLLEKDGIISIEIVDLQGRVVQNIVKEKFTKKGKYSKIVTMESDIAAGNYFIRLSTPLKNQSLKIIKID